MRVFTARLTKVFSFLVYSLGRGSSLSLQTGCKCGKESVGGGDGGCVIAHVLSSLGNAKPP